MWEFLFRQLLRQAERLPAKRIGSALAGELFTREANGPEAYADRIKRDFHLHDYADAWFRYASDPAYWERWYAPAPKPDTREEILHDSVRAAGVPSRYNVIEYGYPEPGGELANSAPPDEGSADPNNVVNDRFGNWGSSAAVAPPNASGSSDSFNDRFGRWGLAPADSFNNSSSPILRELKKYRSSAVPGVSSSLPSESASLPSASSTLDSHDLDFDVSDLPSWMRNALALSASERTSGHRFSW
jgi:hypothetical protein